MKNIEIRCGLCGRVISDTEEVFLYRKWEELFILSSSTIKIKGLEEAIKEAFEKHSDQEKISRKKYGFRNYLIKPFVKREVLLTEMMCESCYEKSEKEKWG